MKTRCVLLVLAITLLACGHPAPSGPNVVLLVMDTTRADRCSLNGYGRLTTPYLERLARESTTYADAWAPAGWTAPSHASLFTGLRPEHHGLHRGNREYIMAETPTLAAILREQGWSTGCITNNSSISAEFGLTQGFDYVLPLHATASRPYPWAPDTHRLALKWALARHEEGRPFFLFINDMEPHYSYSPPRELADAFRRPDTDDSAWTWGANLPDDLLRAHNLGRRTLTATELEVLSDLYDAEIRAVDQAIEGFVAGLRDAGILEETLLIVTADHGENLGEHGLVDHMFSLHRAIRHVPLLIRYPKRFVAGTVVEEVVRLEDVLPTVLDTCALPTPAGLDGQSLFANLEGRLSRALVDAPVNFLDRMSRESFPGLDTAPFRFDLRAVYDGRHHLILSTDGRDELYDVKADPEEAVNLIATDPATVERLRACLDEATGEETKAR